METRSSSIERFVALRDQNIMRDRERERERERERRGKGKSARVFYVTHKV